MQRIIWIRRGMYALNIGIILLFFYIISFTTNLITDSFHAREFIESAQYLPLLPEKMLAFALGFMVAIGISNYIKSKQTDSQVLIRLLLLLDFLFCFMIVYYMNFSYRGIFLLLMMNVFLYTKENVFRIYALAAALIFYIFSDYDIFAARLKILSLNDYVVYNAPRIQSYMLVGKNVITSLNEISFIVFLYFMLRIKINENKAISTLNKKLQATATELELANIQMKDYAATLEENTKMKERNRLAREIHDILGHSLTSITTGMEACVEILGVDPELARKQLEKLLALSRKGLVDVRRSVKELKVDRIAKSEFTQAIRDLVDDINECTPVDVNLKITGTRLKLKEDEEQILYRIIQESITNAIKHGKPEHINLSVDFIAHELSISVEDDGVGCEKIEEGFGLAHIREWLEMLNGTMECRSAKGEGFKLWVSIPVRWGEAYD